MIISKISPLILLLTLIPTIWTMDITLDVQHVGTGGDLLANSANQQHHSSAVVVPVNNRFNTINPNSANIEANSPHKSLRDSDYYQTRDQSLQQIMTKQKPDISPVHNHRRHHRQQSIDDIVTGLDSIDNRGQQQQSKESHRKLANRSGNGPITYSSIRRHNYDNNINNRHEQQLPVPPPERDSYIPYAFSSETGRDRQTDQQQQLSRNNDRHHVPTQQQQQQHGIDILYDQSPPAIDRQRRPTGADDSLQKTGISSTQGGGGGGQQLANHSPYLEDYIKQLQMHNNKQDHRQLLVKQVQIEAPDGRNGGGRGGHHQDISILDQMKPLLRDPRIYERLRGTQFDKTVPTVRNTGIQLPDVERPARPVIDEHQPILLQPKQSVLQLDRPLLEQTDRLQELRQSLIRLPDLSAPTVKHTGADPIVVQNNYPEFIPTVQRPIAVIAPGEPGRRQQSILLLEPRETPTAKNNADQSNPILARLQELAIVPLVPHQNQKQQKLSDVLQIPKQTTTTTTTTTTASTGAPVVPELPIRSKNSNNNNNIQHLSAEQSYMNRNYYNQYNHNQPSSAITQLDTGTGSHRQPQLVQQHLIIGGNSNNNNNRGDGRAQYNDSPVRQQVVNSYNDENIYNQSPPPPPLPAPDNSRRKQELRGQLLRQLEDRDRAEKVHRESERRQRELIEEARRTQEERDKLDAYRPTQSIGGGDRDTTLGPVSDDRHNNKNSFNGPQQQQQQQWPQTVFIRNQLVNNNRLGPQGPVDVLHSIHTAPASVAPNVVESTTTTGQQYRNQYNERQHNHVKEDVPQVTYADEPGLSTSAGNFEQQQQHRTPTPIVISEEALAQAEKVDAQYIKQLKEILMSSGGGSGGRGTGGHQESATNDEPPVIPVLVNQDNGIPFESLPSSSSSSSSSSSEEITGRYERPSELSNGSQDQSQSSSTGRPNNNWWKTHGFAGQT
ncbi:myb-like protein P [Oppia nitens]|uniref:myb-like protein P n=1 Tax=Oppia nitens TaxID=1686743 RepID=UPI0023DA01CB|nr:myb-like protein P [Oppia nitens]